MVPLGAKPSADPVLTAKLKLNMFWQTDHMAFKMASEISFQDPSETLYSLL